jgi:tryptophanyl-tRNA synthetase
MNKDSNQLKNFPEYKVEVLTGIRPSGDLTIANYLGAVRPIIALQKEKSSLMVFVADLHAMTDNEPKVVKQYIYNVVADYLALGLDPNKTTIFLQSDIAGEITTLTAFLSRLISVAELLRVPTLKDKLKKNAKPESANALLFLYPVMMASDILIQRAKLVPVGEDQMPHIELTRELARRFNKKYGKTFPLPQALQIKPIRILSLKGEGKMSKSKPEGAIFLNDDLKTVERKIKNAETAFESQMNEKLENLILIAKNLAKTEEEKEKIDLIIKEHLAGKKVMKDFKQILIEIVKNFLIEFQEKRNEVIKNKNYLQSILEKGGQIAKQNALETLEKVREVL